MKQTMCLDLVHRILVSQHCIQYVGVMRFLALADILGTSGVLRAVVRLSIHLWYCIHLLNAIILSTISSHTDLFIRELFSSATCKALQGLSEVIYCFNPRGLKVSSLVEAAHDKATEWTVDV
jgi:hypothetical protein